jgi:hypothetical protein
LIVKFLLIEILPNQHELILLFPLLFVIFEGALATEMKNMALGAFFKPENSLGAKYVSGKRLSRKYWDLRMDKGRSLLKEIEVKPSFSR